ncbi:MAG: HD domain-containing protein, partial [Bdellovibrionales bacterium]
GKYHSSSEADKSQSIFVVDPYDKRTKPYRIEEQTEIFQKYEEIRRIERLYVAPEELDKAEQIIESL